MKKIINHLKENWIRYGFETFVIIIGILGAFTLSNWNDERKNLQAEYLLLEGLQEDFIFNINAMNHSIEVHTEGLLATKAILNVYGSQSFEISEFQMDTLIGQSIRPHTFNLKTGITNSIISSGEIKLIRNRSIIKFISSFNGLIEDAEEGYIQLIDSWDRNLTPRILKYKKWRSPEEAKRFLDNSNITVRSQKNSSDFEGFFNDSEIMNLYITYYWIIFTTIEQEKDLLRQLKLTNELIDKELVKYD